MESTATEIEGLAKPSLSDDDVMVVPRIGRALNGTLQKIAGESSFLDVLLKVSAPAGKSSLQGVATGRKEQPFNFEMARQFQTANPHHSRSILTKKAAIIGLGFETPNDKKKKDAKLTGAQLTPADLPPKDDVAKIDEVLNPLCEHSWQDTINDVIEDFCQVGNGYLEVVRDPAGAVVGLHHIPARDVWVVIENHRYQRHYAIQSAEDSAGGRIFAKFGDRESFLQRFGKDSVYFGAAGTFDMDAVSEVIHFRKPSSLSRWYGFPDWVSAVASIELAQCLTQHEFDFYLNRGVPEFMLFILGQKLHPKDRTKIETAMQSTIGLGNQSKSLLINLTNGGADLKVQLEKLAMESKGDGSQFASTSEALALLIVTAHGVPPLLAGIQIPGKLGAANEMVQAMQAFQTLTVGPDQGLIRQTLLNTLGREKSLALTPAEFVINTITDYIDVEKADTVARMRQSPQEAEAEGRDLDEGLKKELSEENMTQVTDALLGALLTKLHAAA